MKNRMTLFVLPLTVGLVSCGENPTAPSPLIASDVQAVSAKGTGLVLNSLTGVSLPLVGSLGDIVVDQAIITNFAIVEDAVGAIVGLEVTGVLNGTLSALGTPVVDEQFTSTLSVTSSGPGQCDLITLDLGGLSLDALGLVTADVPDLNLTGKGSGAVGSLLCNIGQALSGLIGGLPGLVNGLNNQI